MKPLTKLFVFTVLAITIVSCKEEKKPTYIITKKPVEKKVPTGPSKMDNSNWERTVEWLGSPYTLSIVRQSDEQLPLAKDEQGKSYYDNKITLKITRADGTVFYSQTFTKKDFPTNTPTDCFALLGMAFDRIDGNVLRFGSSIGSPDTMSDEYIPFVVEVNKNGKTKIYLDTLGE